MGLRDEEELAGEEAENVPAGCYSMCKGLQARKGGHSGGSEINPPVQQAGVGRGQ